MSLRSLSPIVCGALAAVLLLCTRDHNPFSDISNARAVVRRQSIADGDTVEVFSLDTLDIAVAVAELVDSFSVEVDGNRFFADSLVVCWGGVGDSVYRFLFSFYDTGWHEISIQTFRGAGEVLTERHRIYGVCPLAQESVDKLFGEAVLLKTPAVVSSDVRYHWDFGRGTVFHSPRAETTVTVWDAAYNDSGFLWVSDVAGAYSSPRVYFPFSFNDVQGPSIVCVNEGYVGKDTIQTGSSTFPLRLKITDRGERGVYEALADGTVFSIVQEPIYIKTLYRMDTVETLRGVSVRAVDDAKHLNVTTKTFWVGYDASLGAGGEGVALEVLVPPGDSLVFSTKSRYLLGVLWNYTGDSVDIELKFSVNGTVLATPFEVKSDSVRNEWNTTVTLSGAVNVVGIVAVDTSGDTVADTSLTLFYDASAIDSVAPTIVEATVGGKSADRLFTSSSSVHLRVVAFDEGSGVGGVTVNGVSMLPAQDGAGYVWGQTVSLSHRTSGNGFRLVARDGQGHRDTMTVVIFRNSAPVVAQAPSPPLPLFVGSTYSDRISVSDADHDPIAISKRAGPANLTVDGQGNVQWKPTESDTGTKTVEIQYSDGYEPQYYAYELFVKDTADFSVPGFTTTEEDFPVYLEAGTDTLKVTLAIVAGRGKAPFTYGAKAESGVTQPVVGGSTVTWVPQAKDTGWQRLYVTVTDSFHHSDTLVPMILVVGPNRSCSLSVSFDMDTLAGGVLDFGGSTAPETLTFTIHDPDHPLSEAHTVSVSSEVASVVSGVDSGGVFRIVIDPRSLSSDTDTVVVSVEDRAGHGDTLTFRLIGRTDEYRIMLNTAAAGVTQDVYDFPLLVRLSDSNFDFSGARAGGADVRFRKTDGTPLPFEIERWDAGDGVAEIWVLLDTVHGNSSDQSVGMYLEGPSASSASNGGDVFDTASGYEGVYHFSGNFNDATSNMNAGADSGGVTVNNAGIVGTAALFGSQKFIALPSGSGLPVYTPQGRMMVSAWVKYGSSGSWQTIYSESNRSPYCLPFNQVAIDQGALGFAWRDDADNSWWISHCSTAKNDNQWHLLVHVHNANVDSFFLDGAFVNSVVDFHDRGTTTLTVATIGTLCRPGCSIGNIDYFIGSMDEVRIQNGGRDPAWIRLCYESQKPGATFVTVQAR